MLKASGKCGWINGVRLIVRGLERLVDKTALEIASTRELLCVFEQWNHHSLKGRLLRKICHQWYLPRRRKLITVGNSDTD